MIPSLASAVREHENQRTELTADIVEKKLNELRSVNPIIPEEFYEQKQFVGSISKILSVEDSRSPLGWTAVNVLSELCSAPGNDQILSDLQKLTPMVSKFMFVNLKDDDKICVLNILQALTFGIRIPHSDAFVAPLIVSLLDCSKSENETIIQLSLSVLANILHRNTAVLSSLVKTVNVKNFMRDLLCGGRTVICKMEVCKLMFLLEDLIHEKPDKDDVLNFIRVTFCTVLRSVRSHDTSHLQHCILFFADMVNDKKINATTLNNPWFFENVQRVIELLGNDQDKTDLCCAMLLFKFLRIFIKMEIPSFSKFHELIMEQGIAWTREHKHKASEAIITMQCVLVSQIKLQSNQGDGMTVDELITVFMPLLKETSSFSDHFFLTVLLDFLGTTLEVDLYRIVLKEYLDYEIFESFLESVPSNLNTYSSFSVLEPTVRMYLHLLLFISKIVKCCDNSWRDVYTRLFQDQRVVSMLASAIVFGSSELKGKVLSLVHSGEFPAESIELLAQSMTECGSSRIPSLSTLEDNSNNLQMSSEVASRFAEIDNWLRKIKSLIDCNKLQDISSIKILQLYRHKEQVDSDYQKSLVASLTRATEERTLLQEQLHLANQISSEFRQELCRLQPAFDEMSNKYDSALKAVEEKEQYLCDLKKRIDEEKTACHNQIKNLKENSEKLDKELAKSSLQIQDLKQQLIYNSDTLNSALEEKQVLEKELEALNVKFANLTKEHEIVEKNLVNKSRRVDELEEEKSNKEREIQELQRIRDTVFQLTANRKKM